MSKPKFPKAILEKAKMITGKRSRVVVNHILEHGSITTEDLENYGYKHPPRAIRDVREQGLPLEMFWTKNRSGRKIAGYRFGSVEAIRHDRLEGRRILSKEFHEQICGLHKSKCGICQTSYESRYLQLDHRVPYEVGGEPETPKSKSTCLFAAPAIGRSRGRVNTVRTGLRRRPPPFVRPVIGLIRRTTITWQ